MVGFRHLIGFICVMLICLSACVTTGTDGYGVGQEDNAAVLLPVFEGQFSQLSLQISGGFSGRVKVLDVTADGLAIWQDMRRQVSRRMQLPPAYLLKLEALLAEIPGADPADGGQQLPGRCRDCVEYRLTINALAKPRRIVATSDRLAASVYQNLIVLLSNISDEVEQRGNR